MDPFVLRELPFLPGDDMALAFRNKREDQWFDRKSARIKPRELGDALIGFANAEGGLIVIGIYAGQVEGIAEGDENGWRQAAREFSVPPVRHIFQTISCLDGAGRETSIAILEIEASEQVHQNQRGDVYLRVGDENRRLRTAEIVELEYDKGQAVYDGRPVPGATREDLDPRLTERYAEAVHVSGSVDEALAARGLLVRVDGHLAPSNAGLVVMGNQPEQAFPEGFLRVLEYQGTTREVGERANVLADQRFEGAIPDQVDAVQRHVRERMPSVIRLNSGGRFEPAPIIPELAWLEAVVNATVHRSYSMAGDHIRVEIFQDRLEVESPGRLPGLVRVENIRSTRFARNPRIARAMADLGYGRELGEGVDRMFQEMQRAGLPDPVYQQRPGSVRVSLSADPALSRLFADLSPDLLRLAQLVNRVGQTTTTQAMSALKLSRPTVLNQLRRLVDNGVVEHVGSSVNDPRGYWQLRVEPVA